MKRYRNKSKSKKFSSEKIGFFTAFSVCIIAICLGLWSTYLSIGGHDGNVRTDDSPFVAAATAPDEAVDSEVKGMIISGESDGGGGSGEGKEGSGEDAEDSVTPKEGTNLQVESEDEAANDTTSPAEIKVDENDKLQTILQVSSSLIYPVNSQRLTKEYSEKIVYNETMQDYRAHTGADFMARKGEAVFSISEGIVDVIYEDDMFGNVIKVTNGSYSVYYCGVNSDVGVREGDAVTRGQVIAQVGEIPSEKEDDSHIHIEIRVGGNLIDPMTVIDNER